MTLSSTLLDFKRRYATSRQFEAAGRPALWYLKFHYRGRLSAWRGSNEHSEIVEFLYCGKKLRFTLSPSYGGVMTGIFIEDEYRLIDALAFTPLRILDLGANVGMSAGVLAAQFPEAEIMMVEPDPRNIPRLAQAIKWNSISGELMPVAIGPKPGRLRLRISRNPTCSVLEISEMHETTSDVTVEVATVPQLLDRAGWDRVDLVKMDVEGVEELVVCDGEPWLHRARAVIMEIHPVCDHDRIERTFRAAKMTMRRHGSGHEPVYLATRD